jgi:bifunctional DNA-binding transcriptional regulator/antitoxin component of YhaV-PrlF toxin-antitoxin module
MPGPSATLGGGTGNPSGGRSETPPEEETHLENVGRCKQCGKEGELVDGLCTECKWEISEGLQQPFQPEKKHHPVRGTATKASGRVGQKGELFPPKEVREEAGLKPGDQVLYKADHGRIEVVKIPGLREAFSRRKTAKITFEEFENMTIEVLDK